jgi:hypothetical protein
MNKLKTLTNLLREKSFHLEALYLIRLASGLKRLELAERSEEPLGEIHPKDIRGTDKWMMHVAHDVAEILGLHTPAFLGSSARSRFGRGAYAFSVSNDAGESLILKIGLTGEISPYQKAMRLFGDDPPSVIPKIYAAGYFDDIGYKPPVDLANSFGYIVMEELEPMPPNMAGFLQELGGEGESFRLLKERPEELRDIISSVAKGIRSSLEIKLDELKSLGGEVEEKAAEILSKFEEESYFEIMRLKSLSLNSLDEKGRDIYNVIRDLGKRTFGIYLRPSIVEDLSDRFTRGILMRISFAPVESSYDLGVPLGKHFKNLVRELEDLGIDPADLHADNIMMRPSTGEIVVSDLGHFSFGFM